MANRNIATTIAIDAKQCAVHCSSIIGNEINTMEHRIKSFSNPFFDEAFFMQFKEILKQFSAETPSETVRKISLIVPDNVVAMDIFNVPTMRSKSLTNNALNVKLSEIYSNRENLKIQTNFFLQNKQYSTIGTSAIQRRLLTSLYSVCSENKLLVETMTFAAGALTGGAVAVNPKLKNGTYLLLDLKDTYARIVFVWSGRTIGFYTLPVGLEFLSRGKYIQEDLLFNHSVAELTVLNARERAKEKKLSILAEESAPASEESAEGLADEEANEELNEEMEEVPSDAFMPSDTQQPQKLSMPKSMAKKAPRKLPKFMQRPVPETEEEILFENFRFFVKWTLSLLAYNDRITHLGSPEAVYVNLPDAYAGVLDAVNREREENGIDFRRLSGEIRNPEVYSNLELFGGLFPRGIHSFNRF